MNTLILLAALAATATGCRVIKVERSPNGDYRIYQNSHWLNSEFDAMSGKVSPDGTLEFSLSGAKSSPSEEFNRTMQTYTTAFIQLAQIAAAAYNPASTGAAKSLELGAKSLEPGDAQSSKLKASSCESGACTDGSCVEP